MLPQLSTLGNLLLVIFAFGLIVFIHELGHFLAARWAGIRVLAFAIGFGPALLSYRKGMGVRGGSSEKAYHDLLTTDPKGAAALSPTEYRLNLLPLGGYVKMLGQEDINPEATSDAPDSYQNTPPWKRMIVISAGVAMNLLTAALLFITVFMIGLPVEPARIGSVLPDSPAALVQASNADRIGITTSGLMPGDDLIDINGRRPNSFNDLLLATAMAAPGEDINLLVRRPGVETPLSFRVRPKAGKLTNLLEIGVGPAHSTKILAAHDAEDTKAFTDSLRPQYAGLKPGMELVRVGADTTPRSGDDLDNAARHSGGQPFEAEFAATGGERLVLTIQPSPAMEMDQLVVGKQATLVDHLLGLTPVMKVVRPQKDAPDQGLAAGDVFARINTIEYPSLVQGMAEIKASAGKTIPVSVLRGEGAERKLVTLNVEVNKKGLIGLQVSDVAEDEALVALPPEALTRPGEKEPFKPAATGVIIAPGTRIVSVSGRPVINFPSLRAALLDATRASDGDADITLGVQRPAAGMPDPAAPVEEVKWKLAGADITRLRALGWQSPALLPFDLASTIRKASSPGEAIETGLSETRRVMLNTYLTFARLAQGTVKVEHLKGPVGIAHLGTMVAEKGLIHLLFFMALISINLAVINFLPLPIVDGGQFLFLVYEQFRGRPVPVGVQNAVTTVGLVLIASMFLIVTFNDIKHWAGF